ncbi:MAG: bifunctional proline dehydrogenase/L-glutamate gamma-semialdehyde dehydrogenase [Actinomycetaceae bacterium]|nr:bifunctional proline dehydrogenase/L-glutamate gamma-semialdehyde dehydrogenase [Actinomycetaceae bacterium]
MRVPNNAPEDIDFGKLGQDSVARAHKWIEESKKYPEDSAAKLLAKILEHPKGLDFTVAFVDEIIRPEDMDVAAANMKKLSDGDISFLPKALRAPFKAGGKLAPTMPAVAVPAVRKVFAQMVGDLVLDVSDKKLGPAIKRLKANGARLNMNLLGEAVLGDKEADKRLSDTMQLLKRPDVDYVSLKVSAVTGPHNPWAYDAMVDKAVEALLPLYQTANEYSPKKFVNLDMEEYKDLHMTIDVFKRILERPEMKNLKAGIVLQTYLPDALEAMKDLQKWAAARVADGGAPIKVRVVKGANLAMEHVQAVMHDWAMTLLPDKETTDANYLRVLEYALRPDNIKNVNIGVAGMNLFTVAYAYELVKARGMTIKDGVEFEMLSGMASPQSKAVSEDVGPLLFYVPVVNPEEYDVAIAYLVRRLEENSAPQNFMSDIFDLDKQDVVDKETQRFVNAFERMFDVPTEPNRKQNRLTETAEDVVAHNKDPRGQWKFNNIADSDPSLPANIEWSKQIIADIPGCTLGEKTVANNTLNTFDEVNKVVATAKKGSEEWLRRSPEERAEILHNVGRVLAQHRKELMTVAALECYKPLDQGDVEVSEAVDFCHYYAEQSLQVFNEPGAKYKPAKVIAVTPPWNFPMAIPCGSSVAALAAGSAVIFKPATQASRTGALLAELIWKAGVPKNVFQFVKLTDHSLGQHLISNKVIERVILTGSSATAERFRSWRPELGLLAETSGKNSIIVTPSADLDLAVRDVVYSAFGHAGQKCSASSLVILVGSVGRSKRFKNQLIDAVKSLVVDYPTNLATEMSPIVLADDKKLQRGLTTLGEGEKWIIKPRKLDDSGHLWSPGVRVDVQPGCEYHLTEYFGPILGIMRTDSFEEAMEWQNATEYGLTAGLHSLDADEINQWLDTVEAGNIYINRGITGAIVRRQPFGGWKRSNIGAGSKAGGPSYLYGFGEWEPQGDPVLIAHGSAQAQEASPLYQAAFDIANKLPGEDGIKAKALLSSIYHAVNNEFGECHDPSDLGVEVNILRYMALPTKIRCAKGEAQWQLLGVAVAGLAVGAPLEISVDDDLDPMLEELFTRNGVKVLRESDEQFYRRIGQWAPHTENLDGRLRLIGGDYKATCEAMDGAIDVAVWHHPVTYSGRVEVLPFVHEQAVSITNHRFGNHTPLSDAVHVKSLKEYMD